MPSIILSDNGVSSGSAGLKSVAASDGALALQTTTAGGTATTAVYVDTSQNVGLGTTPTEKLTINGNIKLGTSGTAWAYGPSTSGRSFFSNSDSTAYVGVYGSAYGSSVDAVVQLTAGTTSTAILNATGSFSLAGATRTANGVGITFPATQSASSDANTLDDYEEGTYTVTVSTESGTNFTLTSSSGNYTKIGRVVHCWGFASYSSRGSGTITIIPLPFTPNSTTGNITGFGHYQDGSGGTYPITNVAWYQYSGATAFLKSVLNTTTYWTSASSMYAQGTIVWNLTFIV